MRKWVLRIFGFIFFSWLMFYILLIYVSSDLHFIFPPLMKLSNIGAFGDSFNILTSLFTGLAFAGMAVSIMYQRESINEQLADRKQSLEEFNKQNKILAMQQKEFQNQSFDNKFFQMIQLLNSIVSRWSIDYLDEIKNENIIKRDNQVFTQLRDNLERLLEGYESIDDYYIVFNNFNIENDTTMKYFFINLYQILKLIDNKNDEDFTKNNYADILRSQLSKEVLILLFYNVVGLENTIGKDYLKLTKKYHFLKEIDKNDLRLEDTLADQLIEKYYQNGLDINGDSLKSLEA